MDTQTIALDQEAYGLLANVRRGQESFSDTIKRVVRPILAPARRPIQTSEDLDALFKETAANPLSPEALAAIEQVVDQRRQPINCLDPWLEDSEESGGP